MALFGTFARNGSQDCRYHELYSSDKLSISHLTEQWKNSNTCEAQSDSKVFKEIPEIPENWELKRKCRKEATRQRRLAIKQY